MVFPQLKSPKVHLKLPPTRLAEASSEILVLATVVVVAGTRALQDDHQVYTDPLHLSTGDLSSTTKVSLPIKGYFITYFIDKAPEINLAISHALHFAAAGSFHIPRILKYFMLIFGNSLVTCLDF